MTTVNQSKERILAAAKELFLARGYAATTVDAICEKAELTKGSFYYSFDSKEDLGLAVLDWSLRRSVQMLASGPHVRIMDPVEKALAFLKHLEKCSPDLWSAGCLLGSPLRWSLPIRTLGCSKSLRACSRRSRTTLRRTLNPSRLNAPGSRPGQPANWPTRFLALVEGSIILAKAHRDPTRIPKAIRGFRRSLEILIAETA